MAWPVAQNGFLLSTDEACALRAWLELCAVARLRLQPQCPSDADENRNLARAASARGTR